MFQFNILVVTLANSEVLFKKCKRRDLSNERNTSKSNTRTKLKPERSTRPIPPKKTASVRDNCEKKASVRDSYKADPEMKKASVRDSNKADIESKRSAKRWRYEEDPKENRAAQRRRYEDPRGEPCCSKAAICVL